MGATLSLLRIARQNILKYVELNMNRPATPSTRRSVGTSPSAGWRRRRSATMCMCMTTTPSSITRSGRGPLMAKTLRLTTWTTSLKTLVRKMGVRKTLKCPKVKKATKAKLLQQTALLGRNVLLVSALWLPPISLVQTTTTTTSHFANASTPSSGVEMHTGEIQTTSVGHLGLDSAMSSATLSVRTSVQLPVQAGASLPLPVTLAAGRFCTENRRRVTTSERRSESLYGRGSTLYSSINNNYYFHCWSVVMHLCGLCV